MDAETTMRTMATTGDESEFGILYEILCEDKIIIGDAISIRFLPCANLFNICCCAALYYYTSAEFSSRYRSRIADCPAMILVC